jgi:hypothetical protein
MRYRDLIRYGDLATYRWVLVPKVGWRYRELVTYRMLATYSALA